MKPQVALVGLAALLAALVLGACGSSSDDSTGDTGGGSATQSGDSAVQEAQAAIAPLTQPETEWTGPTTGPKAPSGKKFVYISCAQSDQFCANMGKYLHDVGQKIGWDVQTIDGKGSAAGYNDAWNQAIALKPDGIFSFTDAEATQSSIEKAKAAGIPIVGTLATGKPGPAPDLGLFTNVSQDPAEIGKAMGEFTVAESDGSAKAMIQYVSEFAVARTKAEAMKKAIEKCGGCEVLDYHSMNLARVEQETAQLINSWVSKYGEDFWVLSVADSFLTAMPSSLRAGGVSPEGGVKLVGADGIPSAYELIEKGEYQVATVPQPINLEAYQAIDEMNRALAGEEPSGYVPPIFIVDADNVSTSVKNGEYDPPNGYAQHYLDIWSGKAGE